MKRETFLEKSKELADLDKNILNVLNKKNNSLFFS